MALKFRRGTAAQKSGSLAFGEPYVNTTLGTLQVGLDTGDLTLTSVGPTTQFEIQSISASAFVSASSIHSTNGITGSIAATNGIVSGSSQITYTSISSIPGGIVSGSVQVLGGTGIVSGSSQVTPLLPTGVISGSSQLNNASIENLTVTNLTTVNETASVLFSSGSNRFGDFGNDIHSFTGSVQVSGSLTTIGTSTATSFNGAINATNGIISGSSQVSYIGLNNIPSGIISSSAQIDTLFNIDGIVSGSSQITYANISSIPGGIVSGSAQTIVNLPTGTVSGSSQITYANISSIPGGIVSGSAQTITNLPTGTVSGSSQITYASISSIPAGIVSGSSQVTGIGNAQLTNSSTTIGTTAIALGASSTTLVGLTSVTSTAFVGALTGNASTVTTNANLTGNVTSVGNATTIASGVVTSDMIVDGTIVNGDINASAAIVDTKLATISTGGKVSNSATTATSANTISAIVARDGSGNFSAGTITAALTGNASTATTAAALTTARTINGTSFDGSANITIPNLVSGSAQITLSSTTGYGTVINQNVLTSSSPTFAGLTINGAITATGDITAFYTSDKRHKNNIQTIPNALEKVTKLNGVTWEWNDDVNEVTKSTPKTGLIAQEVQEVLPEVVKTRDDGFLALDYSKMMGLMVEAIKEQQTQIHSLTLEIEKLKEPKGL